MAARSHAASSRLEPISETSQRVNLFASVLLHGGEDIAESNIGGVVQNQASGQRSPRQPSHASQTSGRSSAKRANLNAKKQPLHAGIDPFTRFEAQFQHWTQQLFGPQGARFHDTEAEGEDALDEEEDDLSNDDDDDDDLTALDEEAIVTSDNKRASSLLHKQTPAQSESAQSSNLTGLDSLVGESGNTSRSSKRGKRKTQDKGDMEIVVDPTRIKGHKKFVAEADAANQEVIRLWTELEALQSKIITSLQQHLTSEDISQFKTGTGKRPGTPYERAGSFSSTNDPCRKSEQLLPPSASRTSLSTTPRESTSSSPSSVSPGGPSLSRSSSRATTPRTPQSLPQLASLPDKPCSWCPQVSAATSADATKPRPAYGSQPTLLSEAAIHMALVGTRGLPIISRSVRELTSGAGTSDSRSLTLCRNQAALLVRNQIAARQQAVAEDQLNSSTQHPIQVDDMRSSNFNAIQTEFARRTQQGPTQTSKNWSQKVASESARSAYERWKAQQQQTDQRPHTAGAQSRPSPIQPVTLAAGIVTPRMAVSPRDSKSERSSKLENTESVANLTVAQIVRLKQLNRKLLQKHGLSRETADRLVGMLAMFATGFLQLLQDLRASFHTTSSVPDSVAQFVINSNPRPTLKSAGSLGDSGLSTQQDGLRNTLDSGSSEIAGASGALDSGRNTPATLDLHRNASRGHDEAGTTTSGLASSGSANAGTTNSLEQEDRAAALGDAIARIWKMFVYLLGRCAYRVDDSLLQSNSRYTPAQGDPPGHDIHSSEGFDVPQPAALRHTTNERHTQDEKDIDDDDSRAFAALGGLEVLMEDISDAFSQATEHAAASPALALDGTSTASGTMGGSRRAELLIRELGAAYLRHLNVYINREIELRNESARLTSAAQALSAARQRGEVLLRQAEGERDAQRALSAATAQSNAALEAECAQWRARAAQSQRRLEMLAEDEAACASRWVRFNQTKRELWTQSELFKQSTASLSQQTSFALRALAQLKTRLKVVSVRKTALEEAHAALKVEYAQLLQRIEAVTHANGILSAAIMARVEEKEKYEVILEGVLTECKRLDDLTANLNETIAELDARVQASNDEVDRRREEIRSLEASVQECADTVEATKQGRSQTEEQTRFEMQKAEELRENINRVMQEVEYLAVRQANAQSQVDSTVVQVTVLKSTAEMLKKQVHQAEEKVREAGKDLTHLRRQVEGQQLACAMREKELSVTQGRTQRANADHLKRRQVVEMQIKEVDAATMAQRAEANRFQVLLDEQIANHRKKILMIDALTAELRAAESERMHYDAAIENDSRSHRMAVEQLLKLEQRLKRAEQGNAAQERRQRDTERRQRELIRRQEAEDLKMTIEDMAKARESLETETAALEARIEMLTLEKENRAKEDAEKLAALQDEAAALRARLVSEANAHRKLESDVAASNLLREQALVLDAENARLERENAELAHLQAGWGALKASRISDQIKLKERLEACHKEVEMVRSRVSATKRRQRRVFHALRSLLAKVAASESSLATLRHDVAQGILEYLLHRYALGHEAITPKGKVIIGRLGSSILAGDPSTVGSVYVNDDGYIQISKPTSWKKKKSTSDTSVGPDTADQGGIVHHDADADSEQSSGEPDTVSEDTASDEEHNDPSNRPSLVSQAQLAEAEEAKLRRRALRAQRRERLAHWRYLVSRAESLARHPPERLEAGLVWNGVDSEDDEDSKKESQKERVKDFNFMDHMWTPRQSLISTSDDLTEPPAGVTNVLLYELGHALSFFTVSRITLLALAKTMLPHGSKWASWSPAVPVRGRARLARRIFLRQTQEGYVPEEEAHLYNLLADHVAEWADLLAEDRLSYAIKLVRKQEDQEDKQRSAKEKIQLREQLRKQRKERRAKLKAERAADQASGVIKLSVTHFSPEALGDNTRRTNGFPESSIDMLCRKVRRQIEEEANLYSDPESDHDVSDIEDFTEDEETHAQLVSSLRPADQQQSVPSDQIDDDDEYTDEFEEPELARWRDADFAKRAAHAAQLAQAPDPPRPEQLLHLEADLTLGINAVARRAERRLQQGSLDEEDIISSEEELERLVLLERSRRREERGWQRECQRVRRLRESVRTTPNRYIRYDPQTGVVHQKIRKPRKIPKEMKRALISALVAQREGDKNWWRRRRLQAQPLVAPYYITPQALTALQFRPLSKREQSTQTEVERMDLMIQTPMWLAYGFDTHEAEVAQRQMDLNRRVR